MTKIHKFVGEQNGHQCYGIFYYFKYLLKERERDRGRQLQFLLNN